MRTGISAVVATYNRKEELEKLLTTFVTNKYESLEVIIVDQNEDGLIDEVVETLGLVLDIKHLKLKVPNQSKARNIGARQAKYEIVCFPDDDCWFDDDSLLHIDAFFRSNKSADILLMNWRQNLRPGGTVSRKISKQLLYSFKAPFHYGTIVQIYKKEIFLALGGFNETIGIGMYIGAGEDSELPFRAAKNKVNIFYDAKIYVNHKYTAGKNRDSRSIRTRERGIGFIYSKYHLLTPVLLRGLCSPLLNLLVSLDSQNRKQYFFCFLGRVEGLVYGLKTKA